MELRKYTPKPEMVEIFRLVITEEWYAQTGNLKDGKKEIISQIKELEERISYIRDLLSAKKLEPDDFKEMKSEYVAKLERLETKLSNYDDEELDIEKLLDMGISNLLMLEETYTSNDIEMKRKLISSMYPENLVFEGSALRTNRINEAVNLIYLISNNLDPNKKGQNRKNSVLSCKVGVAGFEPTTSTSQMWRDTGLRYTPMVVSPFSRCQSEDFLTRLQR